MGETVVAILETNEGNTSSAIRVDVRHSTDATDVFIGTNEWFKGFKVLTEFFGELSQRAGMSRFCIDQMFVHEGIHCCAGLNAFSGSTRGMISSRYST